MPPPPYPTQPGNTLDWNDDSNEYFIRNASDFNTFLQSSYSSYFTLPQQALGALAVYNASNGEDRPIDPPTLAYTRWVWTRDLRWRWDGGSCGNRTLSGHA